MSDQSDPEFEVFVARFEILSRLNKNGHLYNPGDWIDIVDYKRAMVYCSPLLQSELSGEIQYLAHYASLIDNAHDDLFIEGDPIGGGAIPSLLKKHLKKGYRVIMSEDFVAELYNGKSIALVGSSNMIVGSGLGKYIDSHDTVIRMNKSIPLNACILPPTVI